MISSIILQSTKIPALVATIALGAMGLPMLAAGLSNGSLNCAPSVSTAAVAPPTAEVPLRTSTEQVAKGPSEATPVGAGPSAERPHDGLAAIGSMPGGIGPGAAGFGLDLGPDLEQGDASRAPPPSGPIANFHREAVPAPGGAAKRVKASRSLVEMPNMEQGRRSSAFASSGLSRAEPDDPGPQSGIVGGSSEHFNPYTDEGVAVGDQDSR